MTHQYTAYGLTINSALAIPEFLHYASESFDVHIAFGKLEDPPDPEAVSYFDVGPQRAFLYWKQVGGFLIRNGNEIVIDPISGVEDGALRLPLLGAALATLLHQRGLFVLHASAVAIAGGAAIFLGAKGQGKSTLAATLYGRGHSLLADDIVALVIGSDGLATVISGFPHIKLWPEAAAAALGDNPDDLPNLMTGYDKRSRSVADSFTSQSHPLRAVFSLSEGEDFTIRLLEPQAAVAELVRHSYMARFDGQLLQGQEAATHLNKCANLIRQRLVYGLERPRSLDLLRQVARLVESHLEHDRELLTV